MTWRTFFAAMFGVWCSCAPAGKTEDAVPVYGWTSTNALATPAVGEHIFRICLLYTSDAAAILLV